MNEVTSKILFSIVITLLWTPSINKMATYQGYMKSHMGAKSKWMFKKTALDSGPKII
jgi:hypothetical protein